jgi:hypothetical protein
LLSCCATVTLWGWLATWGTAASTNLAGGTTRGFSGFGVTNKLTGRGV